MPPSNRHGSGRQEMLPGGARWMRWMQGMVSVGRGGVAPPSGVQLAVIKFGNARALGVGPDLHASICRDQSGRDG
jgi:hypothetical protein